MGYSLQGFVLSLCLSKANVLFHPFQLSHEQGTTVIIGIFFLRGSKQWGSSQLTTQVNSGQI